MIYRGGDMIYASHMIYASRIRERIYHAATAGISYRKKRYIIFILVPASHDVQHIAFLLLLFAFYILAWGMAGDFFEGF